MPARSLAILAALTLAAPASASGAVYASGVIYVTCDSGVQAVLFNPATGSLSLKPGWAVTSGAIGPPVVAGGLIWSAGYGDGVLYGLDPSSGDVRFSADLGAFMHFASPGAGGGLLFAANDERVTAFRVARTPPPSPSATTLTASAAALARAQSVTLVATVSPRPVGGTVTFTDAGRAIAGCTLIAVGIGAPQAVCRRAFHRAGIHKIAARYGGDQYLGASVSAGLSLHVFKRRPRVSNLRLTRRTLLLTLSERARIVVVIARLTSPHRTRRVRTLPFSGHRGHNSFKLRLGGLTPGRYLAVVTARDRAGLRSKPARISFRVR